MILYDYFRSTACFRVRIALHYKNISYQQQFVHLARDGGEQFSATYQQKNPQSKVPLLIDNDHTIIQSLAILEYLEEQYPNPPLLPNDIYARAYVRSIANLIACDMHPLNNIRVLKYLTHDDLKLSEEQKMIWYHHWLKDGFDALEKILEKNESRGRCCYGDEPTMADICLVPQVYNANRFNFSLESYPLIKSISDHCLEFPFFQKAYPDNQPDAE